MYEQIAGESGLWKQIPFVDADGKTLQYTVTLKTDLGDVVIELWPDVAPNHVRNFLALTKAGYYDGLVFHATVRQQLIDDTGGKHPCEVLEAGCPLGTGEAGYGSIGYWLKPELHDPAKNPKVIHGEGTVGAWHGEEPATAACKFYITLSKAPWMDGGYTVFGKVTQGLDVARKILNRPTFAEPGLQDRPREPVVIRSATIQTTPGR
jgi:peptidyl-prolyl cis-trans isomerase B (cyclophilin B)